MMTIEHYDMDDYEHIINLWERAGINVGSSDTREEIEKMLNRNPNLFLVGRVDEKIIAVVLGGYDGRRGYVHHLAVDPEYQNKGYGKNLMDELMLRFKNMKVHKIHLFIEKYNRSVIDFYMKLGWEIRGDLVMMSFIPDENLYKWKL
ncbi:MAG: GNAT family N-acetyltransferase [Promethearchaeota archaeon]|nr:MAG: GNAT family N-acetyltransferase [Candidatus Lokiarchaeota archaeon]